MFSFSISKSFEFMKEVRILHALTALTHIKNFKYSFTYVVTMKTGHSSSLAFTVIILKIAEVFLSVCAL